MYAEARLFIDAGSVVCFTGLPVETRLADPWMGY